VNICNHDRWYTLTTESKFPLITPRQVYIHLDLHSNASGKCGAPQSCTLLVEIPITCMAPKWGSHSTGRRLRRLVTSAVLDAHANTE
jgi:hypothetical protein